MKKILLITLLLLLNTIVFAQKKKAEDFGFKHIQFTYLHDPVDILIKSKKGEEAKEKPILLYCQGNLPIPLIITDEGKPLKTFPFNEDSLIINYHLVIISKPYIPVIADRFYLNGDHSYTDSTRTIPAKYIDRNTLDYYIGRNIEVLKYLQEQKWASKNQLVVAGHMEGCTLAAKLAMEYNKVTQLIYSSGNPYGYFLSILAESRSHESEPNMAYVGEDQLKYWEFIAKNKSVTDNPLGETYQSIYQLNSPSIDYLKQLTIPVLVTYGTRDWSAPYNDLLRFETITAGKTNFTYKAYIGMEKNYFPVNELRAGTYEVSYWNQVGYYWYNWLKKQ